MPIDNLPGDAINANIESIKEHLEDTAWAQVLANGILSFKVAQNSFQYFPRRRFLRVIITTLYQLMLQS